MGANSKIEWTDHTASPWHGCSKVHAGCDHCYAEAMSVRNPGTLGVWGESGVRVKSKSFISNLRKWNLQGEKEGRVISVFPSLCDPFEDRPELVPWRQEMFAVADECPWIRLLLLTKRPQNVRRMWPLTPDGSDSGESDELPRPNVWLGCSVSDQATYDQFAHALYHRCRDLAPVLFLSLEPLLGPIKMWHEYDGHKVRNWQGCFDWVIVGGESGPHARPCRPEWVRSIKNQCKAAGIPCFVKQMGANVVTRNDMIEDTFNNGLSGWPDPHVEHNIHGFLEEYQGADCRICLRDKKGGDWDEWPEDLRVRELPEVQP